MRYIFYILLPINLFSQEIIIDCENNLQSYSVSYSPDKIYYWDVIGGYIVSSVKNNATIMA